MGRRAPVVSRARARSARASRSVAPARGARDRRRGCRDRRHTCRLHDRRLGPRHARARPGGRRAGRAGGARAPAPARARTDSDDRPERRLGGESRRQQALRRRVRGRDVVAERAVRRRLERQRARRARPDDDRRQHPLVAGAREHQRRPAGRPAGSASPTCPVPRCASSSATGQTTGCWSGGSRR